jgi:hypothetical protein
MGLGVGEDLAIGIWFKDSAAVSRPNVLQRVITRYDDYGGARPPDAL